jgi:superfamily II DNA helicase RecQ/very-short-patch-repair endonuclease
LLVEEALLTATKTGQKNVSKQTGEITFALNELSKAFREKILLSLCIVDPDLTDGAITIDELESWENHSPSEAEYYFYSQIANKIDNNSFQQLLAPQRSFNSILKLPDFKVKRYLNRQGNDGQEFFRQKVDFAVQFPTWDKYSGGVVIEIDGSQHSNDNQRTIDRRRDKAILKKGWYPTIRIPVHDLNAKTVSHFQSKFAEVLAHPYAKYCQRNMENPLYIDLEGRKALQLALSPFLVARIQKVLLKSINAGILSLDDQEWAIAILERDIPGSYLALVDFMNMMNHLFLIEGEKRRLPVMKLKVISNPKYDKERFDETYKSHFKELKDSESAHLCIDISILQCTAKAVIDDTFRNECRNTVTIRSSFYPNDLGPVATAAPISFRANRTDMEKGLHYFLQNIFRKSNFREGQLEILRRTLQRRDVISLLPTGAGKSLTYQLSGLLQPGLVLIIDPLKSLMLDQKANLEAMGIDKTTFINSTLSLDERLIAIENMTKGTYQFIFISPERLQIPEFRDHLTRMHRYPFTYCVVDEAHCVSEWGHDFRTAYLRLGENARKYCQTADKKPVPVIGLTGTASFDVLTDVQRELQISDINAIISPAKYEREELHFRISEVKSEKMRKNEAYLNIQKAVGRAKQNYLTQLLQKDIPQSTWSDDRNYFDIAQFLNSNGSNYPNAGIVFCPHVGKGGGHFGVLSVKDHIVQEIPELEPIADVFAGALADEENGGRDLTNIQNDFKQNRTRLLVATKAFGMGIDKPNIRFTVHLNMPQSIESFYQEAGRAGRDKQNAYCHILYCKTEAKDADKASRTIDSELMMSFFRNSFRGVDKEKRILWELLKEITFPKYYRVEELNETINNTADFPCRLKVWTARNSNPQRKHLYVNGENYPETVGYINLRSGERRPEHRPDQRFLNDAEANDYLQHVLNEIIRVMPAGQTLLEYVDYKKEFPNEDGIERKLDRLTLGYNDTVRIGFRNNNFDQMVELLNQQNMVWDEKMVEEASNYTHTFKDFYENLSRAFKKQTRNNLQMSSSMKKQLSRLYSSIRDQADTFKAVYRLSVIGIIKDYEVDYSSRTITAVIEKVDDETYVENLVDYVGRYVTAEEQRQADVDIRAAKGDTILQKCCGYLIEFVYNNIAAKRKNAIYSMETAIRRGLDGGIDKFQDEVNFYFDSKYLVDLRDEFRGDNIDVLWRYMDKVTNQDDLNHLNGACSRLLDDNPNHPILMLLRAFPRMALPGFDRDMAFGDFRDGWLELQVMKYLSRLDLTNYLLQYFDKISAYDSALDENLNLFMVDFHRVWLQDLNQKLTESGAYARI